MVGVGTPSTRQTKVTSSLSLRDIVVTDVKSSLILGSRSEGERSQNPNIFKYSKLIRILTIQLLCILYRISYWCKCETSVYYIHKCIHAWQTYVLQLHWVSRTRSVSLESYHIEQSSVFSLSLCIPCQARIVAFVPWTQWRNEQISGTSDNDSVIFGDPPCYICTKHKTNNRESWYICPRYPDTYVPTYII